MYIVCPLSLSLPLYSLSLSSRSRKEGERERASGVRIDRRRRGERGPHGDALGKPRATPTLYYYIARTSVRQRRRSPREHGGTATSTTRRTWFLYRHTRAHTYDCIKNISRLQPRIGPFILLLLQRSHIGECRESGTFENLYPCYWGCREASEGAEEGFNKG